MTNSPRPGWFARHKILTTLLATFLFVGFVGVAGGGEDEPPTATNNSSNDRRVSGKADASGSKGVAESAVTTNSKAKHEKTKHEKTKHEKTKHKPTYLVARVVDGDTLELDNGQSVRLVGIDSPERGECGYEAASKNLARLVLGKQVRLTVSDEDTDRYGRLLRYVNIGTMDAGLRQIRQGFAIARYDSRDGYGFHPREPAYIAMDKGTRPFSCPKPEPVRFAGGGSGGDNCMTGYQPCLPATADLDCGDITGPVRITGDDPYRLDADGDGIGCDS